MIAQTATLLRGGPDPDLLVHPSGLKECFHGISHKHRPPTMHSMMHHLGSPVTFNGNDQMTVALLTAKRVCGDRSFSVSKYYEHMNIRNGCLSLGL